MFLIVLRLYLLRKSENMNFIKNLNNLLLQVIILLTLFTSLNSFGQTCPSSWNEWQWPTHSNWFVGKGNKVSFGDGTAAPSASNINPAAWAPVYESTAAASDNDGNLVIFTNGVKLFDGTGAEIAVPGGKLLTGGESDLGDAGSAVQGVFIARHPLDEENYYIFTTDDAILGANGFTRGFNYFVYNSTSNTCSGATRLGGYRSSEQIAATFHDNGIDVWVSTHESIPGAGSDKFMSYLITCDGIETAAVESTTGFKVLENSSNERASLQFSWDGTKAGATYHNGNGNWDPDASVQLYDFDNATGEFLNAQDVSPDDANHSNPYDCEFSPSGNRLYVSYQCGTGGEIGYIDVGTGAYTSAASFDANESGTLKVGGDGKIYTGTFKDCAGWSYGNSVGAISNPDGAASYNGDAIITPNSVGWGLGNMFVPPQDWVEIQDPGPLTECDLPVNLETLWICKGTDAEDTPNYENAYSVATTGPNACGNCTVDAVTGVFDAPDGAGTYEVYFEICDIKDTVVLTVGICGCEADISNSEPICVGETFLLDTAVIAASAEGIWTVDSVPSTPGVDAVINDSGSDTLFDATASGTKYGIYKLMFRVDDSCEDSMYIEVKKTPTVFIDSIGPFCNDSVAVVMTAIPVLGGDVIGGWQINDAFPFLTGDFDPIELGSGVHKVRYGVDSIGCTNADSIDVLVKERPDPKITQLGPYCANDDAINLAITPAAADSGIWFGASDALGKFTPSNEGAGDHRVYYAITGQCGNIDSVDIHVDAVKDATIATPDSVVCANEPDITLLTGDLTGTWFVNDTMPGSELGSALFSVATYGAGVYELIYSLPEPCGDLDTVEITVVEIQVATVTNGDTTMCKNENEFILKTFNSGGVWYKGDTLLGSELGTTTLDPSEHDGTFKLYYYMSGMCGDVDSIEVTINPLKDATIIMPGDVDTVSLCVLDLNPVYAVNEGGGTWDNSAVTLTGTDFEIDLATLGIVVNERLIYTQAGPCGDKDTIWVTTTNQLDATITQVGPYCDKDPKVILSIVDAGGTFSGNGVDAVTGEFDPMDAGDGTHTITYTIGGNCGDEQTIDIVVNRTPDPTITNATFSFCEDHGDEALTSEEVGGIWREISNTNGGLNAGGAIFNTTTSSDGTFKLEYGFAGFCPVFDTVEFVIDALPVITITPEDTLCADGVAIDVSASALPSTSTAWSGAVNSTGNFDPKTAALGNNIVTFDATNGLCSATDFITIHVLKREDATIDPVDPVCFTDLPFALLSLGTANGTWSGTGIVNAELGVFDPAEAGVGTHTITHTINTRCGDSKTIDIVVVGAPDATIIEQPQVCAGSDVIQFFAATTPGGIWGGPGVDPINGTFNPTMGGTYQVTYGVTEGCFAQDDIIFKVVSIPSTNFSVTPRTGCVPLTSFFTDESGEVPTQSTWDFGNSNVSNDTSGTVSETYNTSGCYDVKLSNIYANGCKSDTTITSAVCLYALPEVDFGWNPGVANVDDNQVSFNDLSSADVVSYEWDFTDIQLPSASDPITTASPPTSNAINPQVVFDSPNGDVVNVKLKVTNANGCVDSIIKPLTIIDKFSIFVPNAFTPNADGINDVFFPLGRNLLEGDDYDFRIYNRWGTLIWKSATPYKGWDGTVTELAPSSGDCAQVDVYVWRLVVRDPFTGDNHKVFGTVSLIK